MSDHSAIEWTDASWNPLRGIPPNRHMCRKISPGCDNCYASTMTARFGGHEYPRSGDVEVRLDQKALRLPLSWQQPRRIFVCSMTDLFGEWVDLVTIQDVFLIMEAAERHQFQVLTKRPGRMRKFLNETWLGRGFPVLPNVWLGTSIELDRLSWRADVLRECPAAVRFISAEPLLGPLPSLDLTGIDWLITGGESGIHNRPIEADWVRDLRDRSLASGVAFFHKQNGGRTHAAGGRELDGRTWDQFPTPRVLAPV